MRDLLVAYGVAVLAELAVIGTIVVADTIVQRRLRRPHRARYTRT